MKILFKLQAVLLGIFCFELLLTVHGQSSKEYSSYRRYAVCQPSYDIRYPKSIANVVAIVKEANQKGTTVKAFGQRHSQSDIICTEGIPIDMRLVQSFRMNADGTATFGAGVSLRKAMDFAHYHGRSFKVMPAYGNITLGGAIGTGAHGSSIKYPSSLSSQIAWLTIVDGNGDIRVITNPNELKSFRIHLGLLGIVVEVTLHTVPAYKVLAHNYVTSDKVFTNGKAIKWAKSADQLMFYWFPHLGETVVLNYTFVDAKVPGLAWSNLIPSNSYESSAFMSQYKEIAFNLSASSCPNASALGYELQQTFIMTRQTSLYLNGQFYTNNGTDSPNPAVGTPHEMLVSVCSEDDPYGIACSWSHLQYSTDVLDNEMGFDIAYLPQVVAMIKDVIRKTPTAFIMSGIQFRFSGKSDTYMSTARDRDTVHLELILLKRNDYYNDASGNLAGFQTILQELIRKFNARSHWGKSGMVFHTREMIDQKLNLAAQQHFIATMLKYDPRGTFQNNFGRRLTHKSNKMDVDPLTTRCALLDICFCSKNEDCANTQTCTKLSGYNHNVCLTKNIGPGKPFDRSVYPDTFNFVDWYINTVPALISNLQCSA